MAKKVNKGTDTQKDRLQKELSGLIPEIGEEGLVFLIKQANTIIHNQRTIKLNREMEELNRKKGKTAKTTAPAAEGGFEIEISRSGNGKTYYFIVNGRKHFFDIPETQNIVALCYRPETKSAALKYLYEFFLNERDEILSEHGIKTGSSPFFEALFREVRANFSLDN